MNLITKYDELKHFIVDADITKIVQLIKVNGNGWGTVKNKNGTQESINLDRLISYSEKEKVVKVEPTIEKINFFVKNPDKTVSVKTIEGEDAKRWEEMMVSVCMFADVHGVNPDWSKLNWKLEKILPIEEKQNG